MQYRPRVHMVDVSSAHVCALTIGVQQPVHSATSVFPAKNRRSEIAVTLRTKLKSPILREFPAGYLVTFLNATLLALRR